MNMGETKRDKPASVKRALIACLRAHLLIASLILLVVQGAAAQSNAQGPTFTRLADEYYVPEIGVTFPRTLGDFQLAGLISFPDPRAGFALRYSVSEIRVDVYIYDAGLSSVPEGTSSSTVIQEFSQTAVGLQRAHAGLLEGTMNLSDQRHFGAESKVLRMLSADFVFTHQGRRYQGFVWVTGYRGRFLKVRASYPLLREASQEDPIRNFGMGLAELLVR
jgi:hypothetical protein